MLVLGGRGVSGDEFYGGGGTLVCSLHCTVSVTVSINIGL